ncbi:MAG: leucine-rich repeat protein [Oscillospiraceae bacterium]
MKKNRLVAITVAILSCMSISSIGVSAESVVTTVPNRFNLVQEDTSTTATTKDPNILISGDCSGDSYQDENGETVQSNVTWAIDRDLTLTISGNGNMKDFEDCSSVPWRSYNYKKVVIENGITRIGNCSFAFNDELEEITIPNTITCIGEKSFFYCYPFKEIVIPNSVTSIEDSAFYFWYTNGRTIIVIPPTVEKISSGSFSDNVTICGALNSTAETQSILKGLKFVEVPFDEEGNLAISMEEVRNLVNPCDVSLVTTTTSTTEPQIDDNKVYDQCDCNHDGKVNTLDLIYLKRRLFELI